MVSSIYGSKYIRYQVYRGVSIYGSKYTWYQVLWE